MDIDDIRQQLKRRQTEVTAHQAPKKVRMEMGGREFMVLERDRHDFEELGYVLAPENKVEGYKPGEYRPGRYVDETVIKRREAQLTAKAS